MSENNEMLGTKIAQYDNVAEFKEALEATKPARLHTFFNQGLFGIGANWVASFVDSEETVHAYITQEIEDNFQERVRPIYDSIKAAEIPEVDGAIRVSQRDGSVYQIFQTERPDVEERVQASYDSWIDAVRELPVEGTLVQYLKNDSTVTLDATRDKSHLVTVVDENAGITLEDTLTRLQSSGTQDGEVEVLGQPYETRDNGPVIGWFQDMKNE